MVISRFVTDFCHLSLKKSLCETTPMSLHCTQSIISVALLPACANNACEGCELWRTSVREIFVFAAYFPLILCMISLSYGAPKVELITDAVLRQANDASCSTRITISLSIGCRACVASLSGMRCLKITVVSTSKEKSIDSCTKKTRK